MNQPLFSQMRSPGLGHPSVQPARPLAPYLRPGEDEGPPGFPYAGHGSRLGLNAERMVLAGGQLAALMQSPSVTPFEQLYRREPVEGMFLPEVSQSKPFAFELGAFRVPEQFALLLFDIRPDIYQFSGIDGTPVPVQARRYSTILGFQISVDQHLPGTLLYQLEPVPIQTFPQAFTTQGGGPQLPPGLAAALAAAERSKFNIAGASSFASSSGPGTALLPQRPRRYGALSVPFTLYAKSNQTVQARCVQFRPLPGPVAFIEWDMAGMLIPETHVDQLLEGMKPLTDASGGQGSLGPGPR